MGKDDVETGGGFVVSFKPQPEEREKVTGERSADAWAGPSGNTQGSSRRMDLSETVDDL